MKWTTLDQYDYSLDKDRWPDEIKVSIKVSDTNSVEVADISSQITSSDHLVYVEGYRLMVDDISVVYGNNSPYVLVLDCIPINEQ